MSDWHTAWTEYAGQFGYPADDVARGLIFRDGYDAGHASAEAKYAPALSAAEAERDLARGNELAIAAISAAHRTYRSNGDLHELARAIGQIINGPDDGTDKP